MGLSLHRVKKAPQLFNTIWLYMSYHPSVISGHFYMLRQYCLLPCIPVSYSRATWMSTLTSRPPAAYIRGISPSSHSAVQQVLQGTKLRPHCEPLSPTNTHVATLVNPCTLVIYTNSLQLRIWAGPQPTIMADSRHFAACWTSAKLGGQEHRLTWRLGFRLYDATSKVNLSHKVTLFLFIRAQIVRFALDLTKQNKKKLSLGHTESKMSCKTCSILKMKINEFSFWRFTVGKGRQ